MTASTAVSSVAGGRVQGSIRATPLLASGAALCAALGALLALSLSQTGGRLIYGLDDAYIHLAVARHFVEHGIWGITPYEFSSSSSSPLWTLLLAATFVLVGPNDLAPFVLALAAGVGLLAYAAWMLQRRGAGRPRATLVLLACVFLTPLPTLVFSGMEHVLHALLALVFLDLAGRWAEPGRGTRGSRLVWVVVPLAAALTATRYEGLFLVGAVCLLAVRRGRWRGALAIGAAAVAPVVAYATISVSHGWYAVPNSVLLKGNAPAFDSIGHALASLVGPPLLNLLEAPHLAVLALAVGFVLTRGIGPADPEGGRARFSFAALLLALVAHLEFAKVGWFFRYEAYLVALVVVFLGAYLRPCGILALRLRAPGWPRRVAGVLLVALLAALPVIRAVDAVRQTPVAVEEIFGQQWQTARFLARYYPGQAVALNDVGAPNYLADLRTWDLYGLGSMDSARARRAGTFGTDMLRTSARARGTRVAVVYDAWFTGAGGSILPREWVPVGSWTVRTAVVLADTTVTVYATDPAETDALRAHFRMFAAELPPGVSASLYTESGARVPLGPADAGAQPPAARTSASQSRTA